MARPAPFFMVYGMGQGAPTRRHDSIADATREAERLARSNPGVDFYVLATVRRSRRVDVETETLLATDADDLIPF